MEGERLKTLSICSELHLYLFDLSSIALTTQESTLLPCKPKFFQCILPGFNHFFYFLVVLFKNIFFS